MKARSRSPASRPVDAIVHKQVKRLNIPTRELRGFVRDEERIPSSILYPRDTTLDPQIVWRGKDEADSKPLTVPAVPIYIQEKVSSQELIEDLRSSSERGKPRQTTLFSDFNGITFDKLVDFYHHEQNWSNRLILGDSLLVMTSLAEKEGLKGKVQMIYMDPPYGIKFGSNWQVSTRKKDLRDGRAEDATRQPEQIKAFRDTWELGIHSYLAYLRDRLVVARELLTESGSIFVQIGDANIHLVRCLLDEVFGSGNSCGVIAFQKTSAPTDKFIPGVIDFLLWYAKDKDSAKYRPLFYSKSVGEKGSSQYTWFETDGQRPERLSSEQVESPALIPKGARVFAASDLSSSHEYTLGKDPVKFDGRVFGPPGNRFWSTSPGGFEKLRVSNRLIAVGNTLFYKRYLDDFPLFPVSNIWTDTSASFGERVFVVQTTPKVIERCVLMTTDPGDLVLDPTCGSGTTAYVSEHWGRRWITIDTSRVAVALARTRIMSARYPYFLLADSVEGIAKESEISGFNPAAGPRTPPAGDIRKGFVYERSTHVTMKSIVNNPDIKPGLSRKEIEASIRKGAEVEFLVDRPYEDSSRIRVTGPFTVESLSPHRMIEPVTAKHKVDTSGKDLTQTGFVDMILENLRVAGVQNTVRSERLKFARLGIYPGVAINAEGEYLEGNTIRRVAICIGPEHGTVGPDLLKEAAKEAVEGRGFDLLVVCGFAFDPYVSEEAKQYGRLTILIARMNPDLAMGDDFLKKTGSGNIFTVFGEPDFDVKKKNGELVIEVKGVDVYDPTTGAIRSHSTDDIACWFIDTDYNGESFFVRQAYFCGGDEPYDRLKKALRAEIDESVWRTLYSTVSRPFERPKKGKIAVKVINHYGDEVLKVIEPP